MEMVAAAKLRRFQDMMVKARPFTEGLGELLKRLFEANPNLPHPFFEQREEKKIALRRHVTEFPPNTFKIKFIKANSRGG